MLTQALAARALPMLLLAAAAAAAAEPAAPPPPAPAGQEPVQRVIHLPEADKARLREEIRKEVLAEARRDNWAAPNVFPAWLSRLRISGDVRTRLEAARFQPGNRDFADQAWDWNAINTGKPLDWNGLDLSADRYLNVHRDRSRVRLQARLAVEAGLTASWSAGVRLATGDAGSPVSTNQTLGASGGNLSKYAAWLDRAYVRHGVLGPEARGFSAVAGRFENPFLSTDLVWDEDVNLDGLAVQLRPGPPGDLSAYVTAGAFPLFSTAAAAPADQPGKLSSLDKWLWAGQLGLDWKLGERSWLQLGAAYYHFHKVEGERSRPCRTDIKDWTCNTDERRPSFAQKGNSYMELRTPAPESLALEPGVARYQYFGLASRFAELAATARLELGLGAELVLGADGEWVRNLGLQRRRVQARAINNLTDCNPAAADFDACVAGGRWVGGATGWLARLGLRSASRDQRWSWSLSAAYRHLESDAVLDAFTDSDFGLGGTNLRGFTFAASLGLASGVGLSARWMSADEIASIPQAVDVLQLDLRARF